MLPGMGLHHYHPQPFRTKIFLRVPRRQYQPLRCLSRMPTRPRPAWLPRKAEAKVAATTLQVMVPAVIIQPRNELSAEPCVLISWWTIWFPSFPPTLIRPILVVERTPALLRPLLVAMVLSPVRWLSVLILRKLWSLRCLGPRLLKSRRRSHLLLLVLR